MVTKEQEKEIKKAIKVRACWLDMGMSLVLIHKVHAAE